MSHILVILCHTKHDMKTAINGFANRHGTDYFRIHYCSDISALTSAITGIMAFPIGVSVYRFSLLMALVVTGIGHTTTAPLTTASNRL
ncbi:MAG: hypothetical protein LRY72_10130 [Saccharospirillaceae bacterium]|nr:hypothetical protein [Saccharospirillaceae bacterium]